MVEAEVEEDVAGQTVEEGEGSPTKSDSMNWKYIISRTFVLVLLDPMLFLTVASISPDAVQKGRGLPIFVAISNPSTSPTSAQ